MSGATIERNPARVPAPRLKKAFVIAPRVEDVRAIKATLARHQIVGSSLSDLPQTGRPIAQTVQDFMIDADLVIAVLGQGQGDAVTSFELGIAKALQRRILVLVPPGCSANFPLSSGLPYIRADATNEQALDFALGQVLSAKPAKSNGSHPLLALSGGPIGAEAGNSLLLRLASLPETRGEVEFQKVIQDALQLSTGNALSVKAEQRSADFAVWLDDLEPVIGNPLLIELRSAIADKADADQVIGRTVRALRMVENGWMLVIYLTGDPRSWEGTFPSVRASFVSAKEFLEVLKTKSLANIVHELRNRQMANGAA